MWTDADLIFNLRINYPMDYLFGGTIAFASRVAANTAAANASVVVFDATRTQLNLLAAAAAAAGGKRRKKRLVSADRSVWGQSFIID